MQSRYWPPETVRISRLPASNYSSLLNTLPETHGIFRKICDFSEKIEQNKLQLNFLIFGSFFNAARPRAFGQKPN